jgi:hypothetical protein
MINGIRTALLLGCCLFKLTAAEPQIGVAHFWNQRSADHAQPLLVCCYYNQGDDALLFDANPWTIHRFAAVAFLVVKDEATAHRPCVLGDRIPLDADSLDMLDRDEAPILKAWVARDDLLLMPGEGYARQVAFDEDWLADLKDRLLTFSAMVPTKVSMARPGQWAAVAKGGELQFEDQVQMYSPPIISLAASGGSQDTNLGPWPTTEHGLGLQIHQLSCDAESLRMLHVIGNSGQHTLYLEQNVFRPHELSWTLSTADAEHKLRVDEAFAYRSPARAAIPLFPGELLVWVDSMPLRGAVIGDDSTVRVALEALYQVDSPTADVQRQALTTVAKVIAGH